ncbi:phage holin family protein [Pseudoroseicyclus tamaricis]|uniref:Phage holin family protein n=1 Tax=Pseudoroseicyclus tamaricis TaxID=2705421 RepID=A0A6B2K1P2_9RHOB|nr:phage holin family protein [Pseudoroseicyclus tamaricis]NDV02404.1 phage holin family protein [Pseudoroseicyclus tamaricis]
MEDKSAESTSGLFSEVLRHVSSLVRNEVDLARAEVQENLKHAAAGIGMIIAAVALALTALNVLAAAISAGLAELGIEPGWAALIVGVVFALIAWALLARGVNSLKLNSLAPTRTAENIKRDTQAVTGNHHAKG